MTIRRNHYLEQRGHTWYYVRRVLSRYQSIDKRRRVKKALHTDSLTIARGMRDRYMDSDEYFWVTELAKKTGNAVQEPIEKVLERMQTLKRRDN